MLQPIKINWSFQHRLIDYKLVEGNGFRTYMRGDQVAPGSHYLQLSLVVQDILDGGWVELAVGSAVTNYEGPQGTSVLSGANHPLRYNPHVDLAAALGGRLDAYRNAISVPIGNFAAALCEGDNAHPRRAANAIPTVDQMRWHLAQRGGAAGGDDLVRAMIAVTTAMALMGGRATVARLADWLEDRYDGDGAGRELLGMAKRFAILETYHGAEGTECAFHGAMAKARQLDHGLRIPSRSETR